MPRYVALTTVDGYGYQQILPGEMVFETDRSPIATRILNSAGVPIYRLPEIHVLGFDLTKKDHS